MRNINPYTFDEQETINRRSAQILRAMAHPVRLRLIMLLSSIEMSVTGLQDQLEIPQAVVSHHLAVLRRAGIVQTRTIKTSVLYRLTDERIAEAAELLGRASQLS